jgi:hypothetical protein
MPRFMDFHEDLKLPDEDAIRKHHAGIGVACGNVHRVDGLT